MQLHQLKTKTKKDKKRVGRGGKRGAYSGKGMKGQKSRAGRKLRPQLRDIIKKIPKKRGYRFNSFSGKVIVVNLKTLESKFKDGDIVTPRALQEKKAIRGADKYLKIKILGQGKITRKLNIKGCEFSKSTKEKIEKAGGKIN